jgi:hypothetical protein
LHVELYRGLGALRFPAGARLAQPVWIRSSGTKRLERDVRRVQATPLAPQA